MPVPKLVSKMTRQNAIADTKHLIKCHPYKLVFMLHIHGYMFLKLYLPLFLDDPRNWI